MTTSSKDIDSFINESLKNYGRFSRRIIKYNNNNLENINKVYGFRKGEEIKIQFDMNNNPIIDIDESKENKNETKIKKENDELNKNRQNKKHKSNFFKNNNNNNYQTIRIRSSDPKEEIELIKFEKLGNKRKQEISTEEIENKLKEEKKKQLERECPICKFVYFKTMTDTEKNFHFNECVEGRGEENIEQMKRNYEFFFENHLISEENIDPNYCPYCHQTFKKVKQHFMYCKAKNKNNNEEKSLNNV